MTDYFAIAVENMRQQFAPSPVQAAVVADARDMDDVVAVPLPSGPRQCCADAGAVIACDGETDTWACWICGFSWSAPCR